MTKEEAIHFANCLKKNYTIDFNDMEVFCNMVIEALEQEPYEDWHDVPSGEMTLEQARQAVKYLRKKLAEYLEQEPQIRPKGHWIPLGYKDEWWGEVCTCSECGNSMLRNDYCPNCGADMKEVEG